MLVEPPPPAPLDDRGCDGCFLLLAVPVVDAEDTPAAESETVASLSDDFLFFFLRNILINQIEYECWGCQCNTCAVPAAAG